MKYIYLLLISTLLFSSCELEEEVFDRITPATFFESESDAEASINGAYWELGSYGLFKDYTAHSLMLSHDGIFKVKVNNDRGIVSHKTVTASTNVIMRSWAGFYNIINNSYLVLEYLPALEMDAEKKRRITGEANFLIGFAYFNLAKMFGQSIIKDGPVLDLDDINKPISNLEDTYAKSLHHFLIADTMCIEKSLQPSAELGRATQGAVHAALTDLYLTMGNWEKARDYANLIIESGEYSLMDNFADLWDVDLEAVAEATEVIFAVQFKRDPSDSGASSRGSAFAFRTNPSTMANRTGHEEQGRGSGEIRVQQWFIDECTTGDYVGDYRSEVSFLSSYTHFTKGTTVKLYPVTQSMTAYPYSTKYVDPKGLGDINNENDLIMYRLADIYLMKAEACNELGESPDAYAAFNEVRKRARLADGTARTTPADLADSLSREDFRYAVFTERGVELNFECKRWFDLKRMKRDDGTDYFDYMYQTYIPSLPEARRFDATLVYEPKMKLWPIPASEISSNPNVSFDDQNPYY